MTQQELVLEPTVNVGDHIRIPATVVSVDKKAHTITVLTDPIDIPGMPGYRQRIILHYPGETMVRQEPVPELPTTTVEQLPSTQKE